LIRLVASDIDGTLLRPGQWTIDPVIFEEIQRLRGLGILFCPASGRQYSSLRRLFAPVADCLSYICENGSVMYGPGNPGPLLATAPMDQALARELCHALMDNPDCEVLLSGADTSYLCVKGGPLEDMMRNKIRNNVVIVEGPEDVPEPILKVASFCLRPAHEMRPELAPQWEARGCTAAIAGEPWLDFTQTDKGKGLRQLCAALDISMDQVMAFGDSFNDVPMLEAVGTPYLVDRADPALLARFPNHCRNVEDILRRLPEEF